MTGTRTFIVGGHEITAPPLESGLYVVATPIGNLGDITIRALETLAGCDLLACEDTRVTRRLLDRYAIRQKPVAYHEHNADSAGPKLVAALRQGKSVALVSDAGTPLVSDPGFRLVAAARGESIRVIPLPGASATLAALSASGLPSDDFRFIGFLPAKDGARRSRLAGLVHEHSTLIAFESPNRLNATLAAISDLFGPDRPVSRGPRSDQAVRDDPHRTGRRYRGAVRRRDDQGRDRRPHRAGPGGRYRMDAGKDGCAAARPAFVHVAVEARRARRPPRPVFPNPISTRVCWN